MDSDEKERKLKELSKHDLDNKKSYSNYIQSYIL